MSKSEQILLIEPPAALRFRGPFTTAVNTDLTLKNPSERRVAFKVQTTAPHSYAVRPKSGLIEPGDQRKISITMQPLDGGDGERSSKNNKDRFMVKSLVVAVPAGSGSGSGDAVVVSDADDPSLWEGANPADVMETKLRCVLVEPEETSEENDDTNNGVVAPATSSSTDGGDDGLPRDPAETKVSCVFELPSESHKAKHEGLVHADDADNSPTDDTVVKKLANPLASATFSPDDADAEARKPRTSWSEAEVQEMLQERAALRAQVRELTEENRRLREEAEEVKSSSSSQPSAAGRVDHRREAGPFSLASCLIVVSAIYIGLFLGKFML